LASTAVGAAIEATTRTIGAHPELVAAMANGLADALASFESMTKTAIDAVVTYLTPTPTMTMDGDVILTLGTTPTIVNIGGGQNMLVGSSSSLNVTLTYDPDKADETGTDLIIGTTGADKFTFTNAYDGAFTVVYGGGGGDTYDFEGCGATIVELNMDFGDCNLAALDMQAFEQYVVDTYGVSAQGTIVILNPTSSDTLEMNGQSLAVSWDGTEDAFASSVTPWALSEPSEHSLPTWDGPENVGGPADGWLDWFNLYGAVSSDGIGYAIYLTDPDNPERVKLVCAYNPGSTTGPLYDGSYNFTLVDYTPGDFGICAPDGITLEYWQDVWTRTPDTPVCDRPSVNLSDFLYDDDTPPDDGNHAPELVAPLADQVSLEGQPFSFAIPDGAFVDPDGKTLTYYVFQDNGEELPAWLQFDPDTRTFTGTPPDDYTGSMNIFVYVTDGDAGTSDTFSLSIVPPDVPEPGPTAPTVTTPTPDQTWTEAQPSLLTILPSIFGWVTGDKFTYTAKLRDGSDLPDWLKFDPKTLTFSGTPPAGFNGELSIVLTASDGHSSASDVFNLTVTPAGISSDDSAGAVVYRLYESAFGRAPDISGYNYWVGQIQSGVSVVSVASVFVSSDEFAARYAGLSNQDFVAQLYQSVYGQAASAQELQDLTNALNTGQLDRAGLLVNLSESAEHVESTSSDFENWLSGSSSTQAVRTDTGIYPKMMIDVNGDGRPDEVSFGDDGIYVSLNTGSGFAAPTEWVAGYGASVGWNNSNTYPIALVDINGDGLPDVVGFNGDGVVVALNTGSGFADPTFWSYDYCANKGWNNNAVDPRFLIDVNGDGLPDVVGFGSDGSMYISLNTGSGFGPATSYSSNISQTSDGIYPLMAVDVNGDGRTDIVSFGQDGIYVSLNTGSGFAPATQWTSEFGANVGWNNSNAAPVILTDVNGDGLADVVGFGGDGVWVALNTGSGFGPASIWSYDYGANLGWANDTVSPRTLVDVNGDGLPDVVGLAGFGVWVSLNTGSGFTDGQVWTDTNAILNNPDIAANASWLIDAVSTFTWVGSSDNTTLNGNIYGTNIFQLGAGSETANGGNHGNVYQVSSDTGQAQINLSWIDGTKNEIDFLGDINLDDLWFEQTADGLKIDVIGTNTSVTVGGPLSALQEITAGGLQIDSNLAQLVQAMASYQANNPGFDPTSSSIHTLPNDSALQNAVTAAWH